MEPATGSLRRGGAGLVVWLVVWLGGCVTEPVALDLPAEPDEPFPARPPIVTEEANAALAARNLRTRASLESAEARRHCPLEPRPVLDVPLHRGPTAERIFEEVGWPGSVQLVEPPVELPGAHYYRAIPSTSLCTIEVRSVGCYVTDRDVHCGHPMRPNRLASFIEAHGLAERPGRLSEVDWVHLLAIFGVGIPLSGLAELSGCITLEPGVIPPSAGTITLSERDASIFMPVLHRRWGVEAEFSTVEVEIHQGRVEVNYRGLSSVECMPPFVREGVEIDG